VGSRSPGNRVGGSTDIKVVGKQRLEVVVSWVVGTFNLVPIAT
jgi:hypothetical protein